jgi:ribosomal protein S18 acetylase RimI-like enzyme
VDSSKITVENELSPNIHDVVLNGLRRFNRQHAQPPGFQPLTVSARDDDGTVVGGLVGETGWQWLHVDLLWVADDFRGRGVGRALLRAAEDAARERKCQFVYLDTLEFQALGFYEREGYSTFGVQEDYPPGSRRYYLRKTLVGPTSPSSG